MSCVNELDNAITIITHFIANYRWFFYYISEGISWAFWTSGSYEFVQKILHKWNCKVSISLILFVEKKFGVSVLQQSVFDM